MPTGRGDVLDVVSFTHTWVPTGERVLAVEVGRRESTATRHVGVGRVACVRSAALLNRADAVGRRTEGTGAYAAIVVWREMAAGAQRRRSRSARSTSELRPRMRSPHEGEPVLACVRADGTIVVDVCTHLVSHADWGAGLENAIAADIVAADIRRAPATSAVSAPHGIFELVGPRRCTSERERELASSIDRSVRACAIDNIRRRFAERTIRAALIANMKDIKERLWRPDGNLVSRMVRGWAVDGPPSMPDAQQKQTAPRATER